MNSDDTEHCEWNVLENWPNALFMDDAIRLSKNQSDYEWKKKQKWNKRFIQITMEIFDQCKQWRWIQYNNKHQNLYAVIKRGAIWTRGHTLVKWNLVWYDLKNYTS